MGTGVSTQRNDEQPIPLKSLMNERILTSRIDQRLRGEEFNNSTVGEIIFQTLQDVDFKNIRDSVIVASKQNDLADIIMDIYPNPEAIRREQSSRGIANLSAGFKHNKISFVFTNLEDRRENKSTILSVSSEIINMSHLLTPNLTPENSPRNPESGQNQSQSSQDR
jgi:hypothetical protein